MNFPVWDVPHLGAGGVLGLIAVFHVMISHFAVGGGLYLPFAERRARAAGREDWLEQLESHSHFFLLLTGVAGAVSGVGIWFAIGLASPAGTSTLIHQFVFGWAIEWTFFLVELSSAAVYYYTWKRVSPETHQKVGWLYAFSSLWTLILINGILTFMLTPGASWLEIAGTGMEPYYFWSAFFNPTYWPSLVLRILVCLSLAGIWSLLTASFLDGETQGPLKEDVVRYAASWLLPSFFLMPLAGLWFLWLVPASQGQLLQLGISTIGQGTFTQVTRGALVMVMTSATILGVVYFSAYRDPRGFGPGFASMILILAVMATGAGEQARELLRKPWVIVDYMYSNGILARDVERLNQEGYLAGSPWVLPEERARWAEMDQRLATPEARAGELSPEDLEAMRTRGRLVFQGQCLACHTRNGYRPIKRLMAGRDLGSLRSFVEMLHAYEEDSTYRAFMPPVVGTPGEREALARYLEEVVQERSSKP